MKYAGRKLSFLLAAAYLAIFASRCALIYFPPTGYFYNIDELEMTLSCLDRFLGVPSTSLQWPSSPLQLLMLPVWAVDLLLTEGIPRGMASGLGKLASYLSQAYANPLHSVVLLRLLVAAIGSLAPLLAFGITETLTRSRGAAWVSMAVIAFIPVLVRQSAMATGEAVGLSFALASLYIVVRFGSSQAIWAGVLFAGAVASRITMASLVVLPLLLLASAQLPALERRIFVILRFIAGAALGFLFWCPYIWTDPLRFAKAVLGHLGHRPSPNPPAFVGVWVEAMGISFSVVAVLAFVGAIYALRETRFRAVAASALVATGIVALPLLLSKVDLFPRYFLPLLPCLLILLVITASLESRRRALLQSVFLIASVGVFAEAAIRESAVRGPDDLAAGLEAARRMGPETTLYLPEEALYLYKLPLPRAVYDRMNDRVSTQLRDHTGLSKYFELRGIPQFAGTVLRPAFTEDEQALEARLQAASASSGTSGPPIFFYNNPSSVAGIVAERLSPADVTVDAALSKHRESVNSAILLREPSPLLGEPHWRGAKEWVLYKR